MQRGMPLRRPFYNRAVLAFVVVCLISSLGAIGFHHHGDNRSHTECPVCVAGSYFTPAVVGDPSPAVFRPAVVIAFDFQVLRPRDLAGFSVLGSRAPPCYLSQSIHS